MRVAKIVTLVLALSPLPAAAHAILMESQPVAGATIGSGVAHVVLRFNSRIDQGRSRIELRSTEQPPAVLKLAPSRDDMLVADTPLLPGNWVLRWQVLAVDGHITRGDVPITVQAADAGLTK